MVQLWCHPAFHSGIPSSTPHSSSVFWHKALTLFCWGGGVMCTEGSKAYSRSSRPTAVCGEIVEWHSGVGSINRGRIPSSGCPKWLSEYSASAQATQELWEAGGSCKSSEAGGPELKTHLLVLNNALLSSGQAQASPFANMGFSVGQREGYCLLC